MPEVTVAEALRRHVPAYLKTFGDRVPLGHRKVLSYITRCRTGELGSLLYQCGVCDKQHWLGLSCGNRHCPNCQKQKTSVWLAKQTQKLLPVQHFVVTFTFPRNCGLCCALIKRLATERSSTPVSKRSERCSRTPNTWAAIALASLARCTLGAATSKTFIRMCTSSFPAAVCRQMGVVGCKHLRGSCSRQKQQRRFTNSSLSTTFVNPVCTTRCLTGC